MFSIRKLFGQKTQVELDREKELAYRLRMATAHRETEQLRREMEKAKSHAMELEKNGEHGKAVAEALQVAKKKKVIETAEAQMLQCNDIHEMARTQKAMTNIMKTCQELSTDIIQMADMEETMKAQADNEMAQTRLVDTKEQMEMFMEGMEAGVATEVRSAAGEAALAAIMAEQEVPERNGQKVLPEINATIIETDEKPKVDSWIQSRRENVKTLIEDA